MLGCFGEVTAATLSSTPGRERFEMQLAAHRRWPTYLEAIREGSGRSVPLVAEDTFVLLNAGGGTIDSANFAAMLEALDEFVDPSRRSLRSLASTPRLMHDRFGLCTCPLRGRSTAPCSLRPSMLGRTGLAWSVDPAGCPRSRRRVARSGASASSMGRRS